MNSLKKLLVVIACAGVTGSAQATDQPPTPGALSSAAATRSAPVVNWNWLVDVASRVTFAFNWRGDSARTKETAGAGSREGVPFAAGMPEAPEWMPPVFAPAVVAFIGLRRSRRPTD